MLISRNMIGIYRHLENPYGKLKKYKTYKINDNTLYPIYNVMESTGKVVYSDPDQALIDLVTRSSSAAKTYKLEMVNDIRFIPDVNQPLYYIYEEVEEIKGKTIIHAEAKFAKHVPVYIWKQYPKYEHPIYWIH